MAHAIATGEVSPRTVVVEASSGSTSIALSMVCATLGLSFRAYMPKTVSGERVLMIRRLGGEVVLTPAEQGMPGAVDALVRDTGGRTTCTPRGSSRTRATPSRTGYSTGPELVRQVGAGCTASSPGSAPAARSWGWPTPCATPATTRSSPARCRPQTYLPGGDPEVVGGVPGVVDGMSRLLDPEAVGLAPPVEVSEREALATAREFGRRGLGIGPSSGLNIAAARRLAAQLGPGHHVATVLPDRMERYFSTALFDDVAAEL